MTHLPPEIARARQILDSVAPLPGARERIYRRVVAKPAPSRSLPLKLVVAVLVSCSVASAAYGLGLALRKASPATATTTVESVESASRADVVSRRPSAIVPTIAPPLADPSSLAPAPTANSVLAIEPPLAARVAGQPGASTPEVVAISQRRSAAISRPAVMSDAATNGVSELSLQVGEYQQAVALLSTDPAEALAQLQVHRKRWPRCSIAHEVDLRIVQTLVLLHRQSEAQASARAFLRRYPDSARAGEVRRIAESID